MTRGRDKSRVRENAGLTTRGGVSHVVSAVCDECGAQWLRGSADGVSMSLDDFKAAHVHDESPGGDA